MNTKYLKFLLIAIFAITLSACSKGGGGDDGDRGTEPVPDPDPIVNPDPTPIDVIDVRTGVFLDGPVIGLGFRSENQEGLTGRDGSFTYVHGADVTFFIGDIVIGTGRGRTVMTPLDLVSGDVDETNSTVTNIIRLLQTLDYDGDSSNGLEIVDNVRNAARNGVFVFVDVTEPAHLFDRNSNVINSVRRLTAFNLTGPRGLVDIDVARSHFSDVLIDLGLKEPPEATQTCPNGSVIPVSVTCPPTDVQSCPDGTTIAINEICPTPTMTCPDGSVVIEGQVCPIATQTCPDGTVISSSDTCPTSTKTCDDGSVILVTEECPSAGDGDNAGVTEDEILTNYSGSFSGFIHDNSDDDLSFGNWRTIFNTTGETSINSNTGLWNLEVSGSIVGVYDLAGCEYQSNLSGFIDSTGELILTLDCNPQVRIEAQFSDNHYAAQGSVYMSVGGPLEIGRFNGGHNDWNVDIHGKSRLNMSNLYSDDGAYAVLTATDTNRVISGVLNADFHFYASNSNLIQYSFINFNGEYIYITQTNIWDWNGGHNSYIGYSWDSSTTNSYPEYPNQRVTVVYKSNGDIIIFSPYSDHNIKYYGTPTNRLTLNVEVSDDNYQRQTVSVTGGRIGEFSSTSLFGIGERFEGNIKIFNYITNTSAD